MTDQRLLKGLPAFEGKGGGILMATMDRRPTVDELSHFFKATLPQIEGEHPRAFWQLMSEIVPLAQVFEFGEVDYKQFAEEAVRGGELLGAALLRAPYMVNVFFYSLRGWMEAPDKSIEIGASARYMSIVIGPFADVDIKGSPMLPATTANLATAVSVLKEIDPGFYFITDLMELDDFQRELLYRRHGRSLFPPHRHVWMVAASGAVRPLPESRFGGVLITGLEMKDYTEEDRIRTLGSLADGLAASCMVLSTKGIKVRIEEPSPKLNAKRLRQGKPLLRAVTFVDARTYYEAAARTVQGGHHASPVPHLRRGHIRHLTDGRKFRDGRTEKWINSMLINCQSLSDIHPPRDHYEVVHDEPVT